MQKTPNIISDLNMVEENANEREAILFHGTSEDPDDIRRHGLLCELGRHNAVFLTDNPELALEYALTDQERTGNTFQVLVSVNLKDLDESKLWPDVDHTDVDHWRDSLSETDQCMYLGDISPGTIIEIKDFSVPTNQLIRTP